MNDHLATLAISALVVLLGGCCYGLWRAATEPDKRQDPDGDAADAIDALDALDQAIDIDD